MNIPGMNHETGEMTAMLYQDENIKIIPCRIHSHGSIGYHVQEHGDDAEQMLAAGTCHICKNDLPMAWRIPEMRI